MTTMLKSGGRRVDLLLPFRHDKKTVRAIVIGPMTWDHSLKWQAGEFSSSISLLFSLSSESEEVLRKMRYPDVERVMETFFAILPVDIRDQIAAGEVPQKFSLQAPEVEDHQGSLDAVSSGPAAPEPEKYDPNRMPTRAEIEADMLAHPVPPGGFDNQPPPKDKDTGLGFDIDG